MARQPRYPGEAELVALGPTDRDLGVWGRRLVVIERSAGIGKTRLLADARAAGMEVATTRRARARRL